MPQPQGAELEKVRTRREELRRRYLRPLGERPATPVRGVHHVALICRDVEETIQLYQETIGGVQHLAISIPQQQYDAARKKFDDTGFEYLGPDRGIEESMYFRDPN